MDARNLRYLLIQFVPARRKEHGRKNWVEKREEGPKGQGPSKSSPVRSTQLKDRTHSLATPGNRDRECKERRTKQTSQTITLVNPSTHQPWAILVLLSSPLSHSHSRPHSRASLLPIYSTPPLSFVISRGLCVLFSVYSVLCVLCDFHSSFFSCHAISSPFLPSLFAFFPLGFPGFATCEDYT